MGGGAGPPQCQHVPMLVPAVTDIRDQPSQATEVVTTALPTVEQESKCTAAACPTRGPTQCPLGSTSLGVTLYPWRLPHIPRTHPMPPGLISYPHMLPHVPSTHPIPMELPPIPKVHLCPQELPCVPRSHPMSQGLTPHPQGLSPCPQDSPHVPGAHPTSPGSHLTSPGAHCMSPGLILCSLGLTPCPEMVSRGHQTPAEPQYPQHRACAGVFPTQVAT